MQLLTTPSKGGHLETDDAQPVCVRVGETDFHVMRGTDGMLCVRKAGSTHQARVWLPSGARPSIAWCDGETRSVAVRNPQEAAFEAVAAEGAAASGHARVESPMPGRVVRVLVNDGDTVEAGQPLVIIEAMKMENEVRAPTSGQVQGLKAKAGDTIDGAALLCEIVSHDASA